MQKLLPQIEELSDLNNRTLFFYFFNITASEKAGEETQKTFLQHNAKVLHWWECEYTFIGEGEDCWTHAAVVQFPDLTSIETAAQEGIQSTEVEGIQAFAVKQTKVPAFILFLFKLLRPIGNFLDKGLDQEEVRKIFSGGGITPRKDQLEKHFSNTRQSKAYMINLLQSYKIAQYPGNSTVRGATAYYRRYGFTAMRSVIMTGGNLVLAGRMGEPILESNAPLATKGPWEGIGIMEYPQPQKIFSLEHMPGYKKAIDHRTAGLERTALIIAKK
ncbi:MAG: hypothetical protein R8P61_26625 [Bacteroidia bacterium]|nr:hypothetical protein [Bacteroidia bacterium]